MNAKRELAHDREVEGGDEVKHVEAWIAAGRAPVLFERRQVGTRSLAEPEIVKHEQASVWRQHAHVQ